MVWLYLLTTVNAARILAILPFPSRSHFQFHRGVIQSLYDAGHQITFVSPFPTLITMPNATIIDSKTEKTTVHISEYSVFLKKEYTLWESDKFWKESGVQFCHDVLNLKQIQVGIMLVFRRNHFSAIFCSLPTFWADGDETREKILHRHF